MKINLSSKNVVSGKKPKMKIDVTPRKILKMIN